VWTRPNKPPTINLIRVVVRAKVTGVLPSKIHVRHDCNSFKVFRLLQFDCDYNNNNRKIIIHFEECHSAVASEALAEQVS